MYKIHETSALTLKREKEKQKEKQKQKQKQKKQKKKKRLLSLTSCVGMVNPNARLLW